METHSGMRQVYMKMPQESGGEAELCVDLSGSTIVFDSFSAKHEVEDRNEAINNISSAGASHKQFPVQFTVKVSGKAAAILHADTVDQYMVVDKQAQRVVLAPKRKPNAPKAPKPQSSATTNEDSVTNKSSSDDSVCHVWSTPSSPAHSPVPLPTEQSRKRQLEPSAQFVFHAPMQRPFGGGFMHHPFRVQSVPATAASILMAQKANVVFNLPKPTVILDKPDPNRVTNMKPLFVLSDDEDEPPPKRPAPAIAATTTITTPSPPDPSRHPPISPLIFSPVFTRDGGNRFPSDDFINIPGRTPRNSSTDVAACVVSVRDMLNMDLPVLGSRMSSQDENLIKFATSRSRAQSRDTILVGSSRRRMPSQDELEAARVLSTMSATSV